MTPSQRIAALLPRAEQLLDDGASYGEAARTLNISPAALHRWLPGRSQWTFSEAGVLAKTWRDHAHKVGLPPISSIPPPAPAPPEPQPPQIDPEQPLTTDEAHTEQIHTALRSQLAEALDGIDPTDKTAVIDAALSILDAALADARQQWLNHLFHSGHEWTDKPSAFVTTPDPLAVVGVQSLSPREREVLGLIATGETVQGIARRLWIAPGTVRCHVQAGLSKLGVRSQREAAVLLLRQGLVDIHTGEWHPAVTSPPSAPSPARTTPAARTWRGRA